MILRICAFTTLCLTAASGVAQYYGPGYYPGYGWYEYGGTAAGDYARGAAEMIHAAGEQNLRNSEAAKNYEDARSKYFDNRLKGTQTYFELRKMNRAYRNAERPPRLSTEAAYRIARESAPDRPTTSQLDPKTGKITWPVALTVDAYSADRRLLERLFADRAFTGRADGEVYFEIKAAINRLLVQLKANVKTLSPDEYLAAKKLLQGLAYEARFPTSTQIAAS